MTNRFLQIHWLAGYPASLLNRDEAGLAKRMPFGGTTRGRISSQCFKRALRFAGTGSHAAATAHAFALQNLNQPMGERTKEVVERRVMPQALARQPASDAVRDIVAETLLKLLYGEKAADATKRQALFFGAPEIAYLAAKAAEALAEADPDAAKAVIEKALKEERANLRALKDGAGLESALFGRMVTSDPESNRDAAIHVAHLLTVHPLERELDFMSVVDDLKTDADDAGAAGIFDMELTSGLYYGYIVVDVPLLIANLGGDAALAGRVVEHLVHLIATVSPGAKKGSTAPYAWAEHMLVEAGARQPRTLANAYRDPVKLAAGDGLLVDAVSRGGAYLAQLDAAFDVGLEARRQLVTAPEAALAQVEALPISKLAAWAAAQVAA